MNVTKGSVRTPNDRIAWRIESYATVVSTQDLMRARLRAGEEVHALVLRAAEQRGGRGRRARDWSSGVGGSYQTAALRDLVDQPLKRPTSALVMALGVAEALREEGVQAKVKWPNDLLYRNKKLAGVLCEYQTGYLLIGIGMNVNNDYPETAAGLRGWDLARVHQLVLSGIERGLSLLTNPADLTARFAPFDALRDVRVTLEHGNRRWHGVARGIDAAGQLRLETDSGDMLIWAHGHIRRLEL